MKQERLLSRTYVELGTHKRNFTTCDATVSIASHGALTTVTAYLVEQGLLRQSRPNALRAGAGKAFFYLHYRGIPYNYVRGMKTPSVDGKCM